MEAVIYELEQMIRNGLTAEEVEYSKEESAFLRQRLLEAAEQVLDIAIEPRAKRR
jgi:hypothetical protein